ncbi:Lytic transglycosylase catalytic [Geobacter metallireducens RCH3]|uniref:Lytic transglycosylase domain protein n=1 Tax=Geobacter metallireducens (strain ATCC 53774 / DSM 7210 / GS-15) TaxID=269799 RepID=Q39VW3_GEOMG|nr:transglycosylase SLT domain-containing protein [Geobacter metallireducens]ABB31611.1 lytic transglycosylase domain protein [Geobacter metallireducens GS-15]EHP86628.1 Lytic transglycosylase catalytic [Geobacter metallireducens RCH3]
MLNRLLLATALLLCLAVSASSQNLTPTLDEKLAKAAVRLKLKDNRGALDNATDAADSPEKHLIAGVAAYRLEEWVNAAELLGKAAKELPLVADYPLFWEADALYRIARHDEALETVKRLLHERPESPLVRRARMLQADILFARGDLKEAQAVYIRFVESYPSGRDSLTAIYQAARCREGLGDKAKAVQELRNLWLAYPASPVAEDAEEALRQLERQGFPAAPYTPDELFRRASTLYSLGRFQQAVKTFDAIPLANQSADFIARVTFKSGQALYKARQRKDAERTFARLLEKELKPSLAEETRFWHAKALEGIGKSDDAVNAYLKIAEASPRGELANEALLEAAFIRKFQGRYQEELPLLDRLLVAATDVKLRQRATWEAAWARYGTKDFRGAADAFKALQTIPEYRERALYWHGRALEGAGDKEGAAASLARVQEESPLSFYGRRACTALNTIEETPSLAAEPAALSLPMPAGYERIKLLIAVGLHDEARKELASVRKKNGLKQKSLLGVARLYLEMEDYNSAAAIYRDNLPRRIDRDSLTQWGLLYPKAFREAVTRQATDHGVAEELVYGVIRAESTFSPTVVSPVGAVGLMQLMPATARAMVNGKGANISTRLTDPAFNINLGVRHLKGLLNQYHGNTVAAVAAYNAGSTPVDRWRRTLPYQRDDEFIENIPYYETREYVKKVLANAEIYRALYRATLVKTPESAIQKAYSGVQNSK